MTTILEQSSIPESIAAPHPRNEALVERSAALVVVTNFDGRIVLANRAWTELFGYPPDMLLGRPVTQFVHPDHAAAVAAVLSDCAATGSSKSLDAPFRCRDGSHKWLYWQIRRDIEPGNLFATAFDVSVRKQEELLSQRRAYVTALRAEIWAPLADEKTPRAVLQKWAALLERSLGAVEIGIWTVDGDAREIQLAASARASPGGASRVPFELLADEVARVRDTRAPRAFAAAGDRPPASALEKVVREQGINGIVLHPVLAGGRVVAVMAACLRRAAGELETFCLEKAAVEIGPALVLIREYERLTESKRAHDILTRSAPVAICGLDREGKVTRWNPAAERLFGWSASDVIGRPLPIIRPAERELFRTTLTGAGSGRTTAFVETKAQSRDGKSVEVGLSVAPLPGADGAPEGALLLLADLSDRKQAERQLALEQGLARGLSEVKSLAEVQTAVLPLIAVHLGSSSAEFWGATDNTSSLKRLASWNSKSVGAIEFEGRTQNLEAAEPADLAKKVLSHGQILRIAGSNADRTIDRATPAGRRGLEDVLGIPILAGKEAKAVLLFFGERIADPDVQSLACLTAAAEQIGQCVARVQVQDALRDAEEKLRQSEKMESVGRLVGGVAHDFNNLLSVILGYGELVVGEVAADAPVRELLLEIVESGKRAAGLTRQLLAFCRKEVYHPVALDLNAHVEGMEKMLRRLIGEAIEFHTALAPEVRQIHADPAQIEQVVMNLVVNARDAMPQGGRLTVETRLIDVTRSQTKFPQAVPGPYVLLSVGDTGCGIDEPTRARIFEPFFTTKGAGKGTGMGLATVQEIVEQCGGHIAVESWPGIGTTFDVILPPMATGLAAWEVDAQPQAIPRGSETILVVEDDGAVLRLMARLLSVQGYRVQEAADAAQALDIFRARPADFDLLLTDVIMPEMNGVELAARTQSIRADLKVLFISGYRDGELRRLGLPDLGGRFLQKPFTTVDLAGKVREILDG